MSPELLMTASPEVALPADPRSARHARRFLASHVKDGSQLELAQLLVSEIVTNAVLHARTDICLRIVRRGRRLRVEVTDQSVQQPSERSFGPSSTTGRGLKLLTALAADWGTDAEGSAPGKTVWFELA